MKKFYLLNNVLGWLCFVIAAVTYLLTMEPTASFWDCPEFISQGAKLEVGHPPGNPIFMLTARFFVTIFGCEISRAAIAVNTMSALLSAATILLLFWTITHFARHILVRDDDSDMSVWKMVVIFAGGVCGALGFAWSDTFWFSAVEGEVYAFSSFCTALVVWLILKWENRAEQPHSDRYILLIAYIIGVSIAVHLLNLLCIPAIVLVFYYKKYKNVSAKGSLIALAISFAIVAFILYGLVPGFVKWAQCFELLFVNGLSCPYNTGTVVYFFLIVGLFVWAISALYRQRSVKAIKASFFLCIVMSGLLFMYSFWVGATLSVCLLIWLLIGCEKVPVRIFNVIILSIFLIFIGYSSYALLLIRSHANTPMNQNAPDNVFSLGSYLNREQYGERPLFYGSVFAEEPAVESYDTEQGTIYYIPTDYAGKPQTKISDGVLRDENGSPYSSPKYTHAKVVKTSPDQPDEYVAVTSSPGYKDMPDLGMLFPRIYSNQQAHVDGYKGWAMYSVDDLSNIPYEVRKEWAEYGFAPYYQVAPYMQHATEVETAVDSHTGDAVEKKLMWKPSFGVNLRYFFNYQFAHMYWRYFMWNFAGRQNDIAGNGEPHLGNWISGIPFIDNPRLGDQSLLPDEFGKGNKGHNVYYMLPLLIGIIGLLWQAMYIKKDAPQRGIEQFWVICFLFFMTGIAIVLYLNQTPGQPRERDYAFAGSFYAYAIWIGMGIPAIAMLLKKFLNKHIAAVIAAIVAVGVPLQMVSQTWDDHDRSGRYTTRDYGMNYLSSVDENGIIFCNGDNDTFPLWYAQEVEGYRTDVRVVNMSYLTTDWYANQQRIPSYDGAPIPMYARPQDYSLDKLAYSFVFSQTDSFVNAKEALEDLYSSFGKYGDFSVMTKSKVTLPLDTAAVYQHYGLDSTDVFTRDIVIPAIAQPRADLKTFLSSHGKGGLNLGNTLGLDFIANSFADGHKRPVFFCSTVTSNYYLNLDDYMYSTGMAMEVSPFHSESGVSPLLDKAYDNIMTKFRWGGLDVAEPGALYLDETVRRLVSSTRLALLYAIRDLIKIGDLPASKRAIEIAQQRGEVPPTDRYDMARRLLKLMEEKVPASQALYDPSLVIYVAQAYYDLYVAKGNPEDLAACEQILDDNLYRYAQFARYAASLKNWQLNLVNSDIDYIDEFAEVLCLYNHIKLLKAIEANPEYADLRSSWAPRTIYDTYSTTATFLYLLNTSISDMEASVEVFTGDNKKIMQSAVQTAKVHERLGIDRMAITNEIAAKYQVPVEKLADLGR